MKARDGKAVMLHVLGVYIGWSWGFGVGYIGSIGMVDHTCVVLLGKSKGQVHSGGLLLELFLIARLPSFWVSSCT